MPFIEIKSRDVCIKVFAHLEAVPPVTLPGDLGDIDPDSIAVLYEAPLGGGRWVATVFVSGVPVVPIPGMHPREARSKHWFDKEIHQAPDWVAGFVKLQEPPAELRGKGAS